MTLGTDAIVDQVMQRFMSCLRSRDVSGAVSLFTEDAMLFGSEPGESARGHGDLRTFFTHLYSRPVTYGWSWESLLANRHGDIVWFVAPATAVVVDTDGAESTLPYRISGVLREVAPEEWLFELFNGAEPAAPIPEHVGA